MSSEYEQVKEIVERVMKKYKSAKRRVVENFLYTSIGYSYRDQVENAYYDQRLYHWKSSTLYAILLGLEMMREKGLLR
ncbi:MAG: hypothetical protein QXW42_04290 [Thermofilum sp.]